MLGVAGRWECIFSFLSSQAHHGAKLRAHEEEGMEGRGKRGKGTREGKVQVSGTEC